MGQLYIANYANEIAYHEDNRRTSNGAIFNDIFKKCMETIQSNELTGYWQGNYRISKELKAKIELMEHENKTFKYLNQHLNCDERHYNQRSMVERVNKLLKNDYGCNAIFGIKPESTE